ncbi:hypothetical protein F1641_11520 [Quadrisphaera sp. INWT6]|nr:hypothetical protein [Quadrisphaera sp. INWT6]
MHVVVDVANAVGSRPDGWWRDRAGATTRLLAQLARLAAAGAVDGPGGERLAVGRVHAVVEGRARSARVPAGVDVVLAEADGDSAVVVLAEQLVGRSDTGGVLVVTADRGLRERLPAGAAVSGPGWLRSLLDRLGE